MCRSSKVRRLSSYYRAGYHLFLVGYKQLPSPALLKRAVTLSLKRLARFCLALGPGRIAYSFSGRTPFPLCIPMFVYIKILAIILWGGPFFTAGPTAADRGQVPGPSR